MKKIVIPVDFSKYSKYALDFSIEFNKKINGEIILFHVIETPKLKHMFQGTSNQNADQTQNVKNKLEEWAQLVEKEKQKVSVLIEYGKSYKAITKYANKHADWIVLGSSHTSRLKELFAGTTTERVVRHARCPTITIKKETKIEDLKNMIFASDLSVDQHNVAQEAKKVQKIFDLKMHLLKVRTPHNFLSFNATMNQLKKFSQYNELTNFSMNTIEDDYSDDGIVSFAKQVNAGLVVIGTHGKTGLAHLIAGSRVEDLVNKSETPLVILRIPEND